MTQRLGSGGPFEDRIGYSRSVATDGHLWVSGCTAVSDGQVVHAGDAAAQARVAFGNALDAIAAAGFDISDVVRTRMYVVDVVANGTAVGDVHGEVFGSVRPATAMIGVAGLLDPRMLVEIELDCYRSGA